MGVVGDFTRDLRRLPNGGPKLMLFLGSTIGNLSHDESVKFLKSVAECMQPGDRFLLGMDMVKSTEILEAAYDDAKGVTAEFNRNALRVLNRELDANFGPDHFDHLAFFNEDEEQVEMHLRANRPVRVEISHIDLTVTFEEGELRRSPEDVSGPRIPRDAIRSMQRCPSRYRGSSIPYQS